MPALQIELSKKIINRLDDLARHQKCPTDRVVTDALTRYLDWFDHQMTLWEETEEAIAQADRGEVHSSEEIFAWLDTWGQPGTKE